MQEHVTVKEQDSTLTSNGGLVVSMIKGYYDDKRDARAEIAIGAPGLRNITASVVLGDALLIETPQGLFEFRVLRMNSMFVEFLLTRLDGRPGLRAGLVEDDIDNRRFTADEARRIGQGIAQIRSTVRDSPDIAPEQLEFISRKLDEMQAAADRLGRKDWIHFAAGFLSNIVVTLALSPGAAGTLFKAASSAFSWLFSGSLRLVP